MSLEKDAKRFITSELKELLLSAKNSGHTLINDNAQLIEDCLQALAIGELSEAEFKTIVNDQKLVMQQFLNTQDIKARAKLEKITVGVLEMVLDKAFKIVA